MLGSPSGLERARSSGPFLVDIARRSGPGILSPGAVCAKRRKQRVVPVRAAYSGILRQSSTRGAGVSLLSRERLAPASREPPRAHQDARATSVAASVLTFVS